jgi:hypothetical protein
VIASPRLGSKFAETARVWGNRLLGRTEADIRPPQVVFVVAVADDPMAGKNLLRLMPLSWKRSGSWYSRIGLNVSWNVERGVEDRGLDAFRHPGEQDFIQARRPYSEAPLEGAMENEMADRWLGSIGMDFGGSSNDLVPPLTTAVLCLVTPRYLAARGNVAENIAELLRELAGKWHAANAAPGRSNSGGGVGGSSARQPIRSVILGITDASRPSADPSLGSGVDSILVPALQIKPPGMADILPPRIALAITGLERDFVRFNARDSQSSRYRTAEQAAWDADAIKEMLASLILDRPHLQYLLENDLRQRPDLDPLTVTAVMPCGFLRGWGCVNYNGWNPGWLDGGPWTSEDMDAPQMVPFQCADPLLSALTGQVSEFQLTSRDYHTLHRMAHWRRRRGGGRAA